MTDGLRAFTIKGLFWTALSDICDSDSNLLNLSRDSDPALSNSPLTCTHVVGSRRSACAGQHLSEFTLKE